MNIKQPMLGESQKIGVHEIHELDSATQLYEYLYYLMTGPGGSGKTTAARSISKNTRGHKRAQHIAIPGNEKTKQEWDDIVHPMFNLNSLVQEDVFPNLAIEALDDIIGQQKRRIKECAILNIPFPEEWKLKLFIDDCGHMKKFMYSDQMKWLANNHRHIKMDIFLIVRKLKQVCTESQEIADAVICFKPLQAQKIRHLHRTFAYSLPFQTFQDILGGIATNYAIIIHTCPTQNDIQHTIFFSRTDSFALPANFLLTGVSNIVREYAMGWMQSGAVISEI